MIEFLVVIAILDLLVVVVVLSVLEMLTNVRNKMHFDRNLINIFLVIKMVLKTPNHYNCYNLIFILKL